MMSNFVGVYKGGAETLENMVRESLQSMTYISMADQRVAVSTTKRVSRQR